MPTFIGCAGEQNRPATRSKPSAAVAGKREATRAEIAAGIQATLGDHQDRVVARQWLIDAANAIDQSQSAFVAGELSALLSGEQQALRKRARKECREACRS